MQYLKKTCLGLAALAGTLLAPAVFAEGTNADTDITNNVSLTFQVNAISQSASASVTFEVDRKLIVEVATQNADWVTAVPGQNATPGAVNALNFLVTNRSNDQSNVRIALVDRTATAVTGFAAQVGGPTAFNMPAPIGTVWNDANDNNLIDGGEASAPLDASGITELSIGVLAEDATTNIKVVVEVDGAAGTNEYRSFSLVAAVADGAGTALTGDDSGNAAPGGASTDNANGQLTIETVFADAGSANAEDVQYDFVNGALLAVLDSAFDGQSVDSSGFITAVALAVAKYVEVLYDPILGNAYDALGAATGLNPKAIPGAVLLYVVGVVNANASLSATSVAIDDDVPDAAAELLVGDQANPATAVSVPTTVTFDVGGNATAFTLDRANIQTDLDTIWVEGCQAANASSQAFAGGDPEVSAASLGTCAPGEQGYVAYLVTINDAP